MPLLSRATAAAAALRQQAVPLSRRRVLGLSMPAPVRSWVGGRTFAAASSSEGEQASPARQGPRAPALVFGLLMASFMFWWVPPFVSAVAIGNALGEGSTQKSAYVSDSRGDAKREEMRKAELARRAQLTPKVAESE
eukprot:TRINITY_DN25089_c0_g1_i1.p1 TRINITY_DN25089_c0_g1~~TRINITY_DN25089_c0_g1_i1.p1  ORF type:complete len:156 (+),score=25.61 TRINITY_DN25089_c0_g1_i1:58-468(+)